MGYECSGVSELIFETIQEAAIDVRKTLYERITLSGGTTMYPGYPARIKIDMNNRYKKEILKGKEGSGKIKIKVEDPPRRKYAVFRGASTLAKIMIDRQDAEFWCTRQDLQEQGSAILKKMVA